MEELEEPSLLDQIEGLPEEMQNELLNYLEYGEVLRLRRVCNRFRHLAEAHLTRRLPNFYLNINFHLDKRKCLSEFKCRRFSQDFVIPKVSFFHEDEEDSGQVWKEFLQNPDLDWFMENYAPYVKYLHLSSLQLPIYNAKQLRFLESFTKLEVLECNELHLPNLEFWDCCSDKDEPVTPVLVPNSFKSLKRLLVAGVTHSKHHILNPIPTTKELNKFWIFANQLMKTTLLEELEDPIVHDNNFDEENLKMKLKTLVNLIESWEKLDKPKKTFELNTLCDFVKQNASEMDMTLFQHFFQVCAKSNVRFEEVEDTEFHSLMGDQFAKYVKSMVSTLPESLQTYNYENLETLEVRVSEIRYFRKIGKLKCSKLRGLSLHFQRRGCQEDHEYERRIANRFFHDTKLANLTSLALQFEEYIPFLVSSKVLVSACANLKYLSLQNFAVDSPYFVQLWKGLPSLEYLKLNGCASLDDDSFIGDNPEEPAICKLKNLKYLELTDLRRMSRVTDKTLKDAIRHIKLRCFRLVSYGCVLVGDELDHLLSTHVERFSNARYSDSEIFSNNISLDGIRSLKTGVFAETIEQFDIVGLKIENVPHQDLIEVQKEFRSWHF